MAETASSDAVMFQRAEDAAILDTLNAMEELLRRAKGLLLEANGKGALLRHSVLFAMRSSLSAVRLWQDLLAFDVEDQRVQVRREAGLRELPAGRGHVS